MSDKHRFCVPESRRDFRSRDGTCKDFLCFFFVQISSNRPQYLFIPPERLVGTVYTIKPTDGCRPATGKVSSDVSPSWVKRSWRSAGPESANIGRVRLVVSTRRRAVLSSRHVCVGTTTQTERRERHGANATRNKTKA